MITKDGRDTKIENLTPENYIVPKGEEKYYHVVLEIENYDRKTGKKLSKAYVQKIGRKIFETHVQASLVRQGYKMTILHNPTEWLKEQQAKAAEKAKADAEAKAEAEKAKFDAAVDAAVAERLDAAVADAVAKALANQKPATDAKPADAEAEKTDSPEPSESSQPKTRKSK